MQLKIKILLLFFSFTISIAPVFAAEQCIILNKTIHGNCSSLEQGYIDATANGNCGDLSENAVCCCEQSSLAGVAPKYIIMGSVAAALGAVAIISFALKKREVE